MAAIVVCEICLKRSSSATIRPSDKGECDDCWLERYRNIYGIPRSQRIFRHTLSYQDSDSGKQNGERKENQYRHGQKHQNQDPKNNRDTNAGHDRPSLNSFKMRVTLSFLNYESDKGNQEKFDQCTNMDLPRIEIVPNSPKTRNNWGNTPYNEFAMQVNKIYEEIVHMRRNIFKIPSGKAGKEYIKKLTFWLRKLNSPKSELNLTALKAPMSLPTLILQKQSPNSKAKEHSECTSRRLPGGGGGLLM